MMSIWTRLKNVFRSDLVNHEIDEELASHVADAIDEGRDPREARRALGSPLQTRERSRDVRVITWLDGLRADFVFGWRQLNKNKSASLAAIVSLGLAMGASIAAFRLVDALLLRPLPISNPANLFMLEFPEADSDGKILNGHIFDYPQFQALRKAAGDQADLIAMASVSRSELTFRSDDELEKFWQQSVSGWMFSSFGLKPALGRLLTANDDVAASAHPVAVLSYDYWMRRFGGDPGVVGRRFRYGNDSYEIVGVCGEGFTGTEPGTVADVFLPVTTNVKAIDDPNYGWLRIWVRLRPAVAQERIRQQLRAAMSAFRRDKAKTMDGRETPETIKQFVEADLHFERASAGVSDLQKDYRLSLMVLGAVVLLVLLIACANVANLMTAQAAARRREMALRVSIGAGRARLVQLIMTEGVLIAAAASALGGVIAWQAAPFVVSRINPQTNPARLILTADYRVLAFGAVLALIVTLLFGLIPALRASAVRPMSALKGGEDPHSRRRLMNALVAAQVAFCFVVCFVTGLFVTTLNRLTHEPTGFSPERVLTLETLTRDGKSSTHWDELRQHLQSVAGVESVGISGWAPMSGITWTNSGLTVKGFRNGQLEPYFLAISPSWLATMGIPMIGGRDLRTGDKYPGIAVVNEAFARSYFGGRDPVGQSFETVTRDGKVMSTVITGYVRDALYRDLREPVRPTVYIPLMGNPGGTSQMTVAVRTKGPDPLAMGSTLRQEVAQARPDMRVTNVRTQMEHIERHTVRERLLAMLALFFAGVALTLAGIGLYGVLTYSVLERRREIGIRIALGAPSRTVAGRVSAEIATMLVMGSVAGLAAGLASQRYLETLLYQVKGTDPAMLAAPALTVLAIAVLASLPPVLYAVRIDPAVTLRGE
ncbi:MAG TPA: ABC transporter permease [Bryobacteraceae bacterium]|jgi:predicted permease